MAADKKSFTVLGVRVDAVQIPEVIARIKDWINRGSKGNFIAVTGFHGIIETKKDPSLKNVLNSASLVVPDGVSLVCLGRRAGYILKKRVYGPELMDTFLRETGARYRHFLCGGPCRKAVDLPGAFSKLYPQANFVGSYSPSFSAISAEEEKRMIEAINRCKPDILWIGISTPKQEHWMFKYRNSLDIPVMVGVGAAFDFLTGSKPQAPRWMRENGLEWFFRLITEPGRLWRRYLIDGSKFLYYIVVESLSSRRPAAKTRPHFVKRIFFYGSAILCFFIIAEITARVLTGFVRVYDVEMSKYALALKKDSPNRLIGHVHQPGKTARLMGVSVRINSDGFRGAEYPAVKNDAYRIILLGDSILLGWGVEEDKIFSRVLEEKMNQSRKVEILNFGTGNYNSQQEAGLFFEKGPKYHPDEILLCYFINDAEKTPVKSKLWFLARSRFITLLWSKVCAIDGYFRHPGGFREYYAGLYRNGQEGWLCAQSSILSLRDYCQAHHVRFRVVILPEFHDLAGYPFKQEYGQVEEFLNAHQIPCLNLNPLFQRFSNSRQFWVAGDDAHPNAAAHRLIADYLYAYLTKEEKQ